jgi:hypothetical protein
MERSNPKGTTFTARRLVPFSTLEAACSASFVIVSEVNALMEQVYPITVVNTFVHFTLHGIILEIQVGSRERMMARVYDRVANLLMLVAIVSALLFDQVRFSRATIGAVGGAAGVGSFVLYFANLRNVDGLEDRHKRKVKP